MYNEIMSKLFRFVYGRTFKKAMFVIVLFLTLVVSCIMTNMNILFLFLGLVGAFVLGLLTCIIFLRKKGENILMAIEHAPEMFGGLFEIESMYIFLLLFLVNVRPMTIIGFEKKMGWSEWYNFVYAKKKIKKRSYPYKFKSMEDLIKHLILFRKTFEIRLKEKPVKDEAVI